jgi:hypothetical protein
MWQLRDAENVPGLSLLQGDENILQFHFNVHKSPPLVPTLSQIDPIPTIPSYLSKIHFNIVHPHTTPLIPPFSVCLQVNMRTVT